MNKIYSIDAYILAETETSCIEKPISKTKNYLTKKWSKLQNWSCHFRSLECFNTGVICGK